MSSLREVKDRIASVRSTLKITSAMKLVASSKLRRAQERVMRSRPYYETLYLTLQDIVAETEDFSWGFPTASMRSSGLSAARWRRAFASPASLRYAIIPR